MVTQKCHNMEWRWNRGHGGSHFNINREICFTGTNKSALSPSAPLLLLRLHPVVLRAGASRPVWNLQHKAFPPHSELSSQSTACAHPDVRKQKHSGGAAAALCSALCSDSRDTLKHRDMGMSLNPCPLMGRKHLISAFLHIRCSQHGLCVIRGWLNGLRGHYEPKEGVASSPQVPSVSTIEFLKGGQAGSSSSGSPNDFSWKMFSRLGSSFRLTACCFVLLSANCGLIDLQLP